MASEDFKQFLERRVSELGLSITELAMRASISRQEIYKLMSGEVAEPKLSTLSRLAKALEVEPSELGTIMLKKRVRFD